MPSLLAIQVSPRFETSTSRKLTALFVDKWRAAHPDGHVAVRDLARTPLPYVDLPWIGGAFAPPEQHSPESVAAIAISNELVGELQGADHIVIGTPMYNFSIPAALKAWIDHIVRVGVTVSPDNVGLLTGKKATIILATGGDSPRRSRRGSITSFGSAGRGIVHNENAVPGSIAHTLQLWVNLPASGKMTEPRYQTLHGHVLPVRVEPGVEIKVLSGRSGDVVSPTLNHVPVTALDARIASGASFKQLLEPGANAFVLVFEGDARVGSSERRVQAGELAWLTRDDEDNGSEVTIAGGDLNARVLLFAGRPLREPVVFGGPFVMNTKAEVEQAYADYRGGRF